MRYWKLIGTDRVISVAKECQMNLDNWIEISKEEFDKLVLLRGK